MKTGVYFCNCGTNISDMIDGEQVVTHLESCGNVAYVKTCPFLCSEEGKAFLEQDLNAEQPDRIVVAACSPREHEATFMKVMERAGMNPYLMQMVNIREQIAWVTEDREQATKKVIVALRAALSRVELHETLEKQELEVVPDVLVIGGGPAGLKAALSLAEAGRRVTLVEKLPVIGGLPVRFDTLFPHMECGPCLLDPLLSEVLHGGGAENIELLTMAEVSAVTGYFGNFTVKIRQRPRYVDAGSCIGCGACSEPCPASGPDHYNCGMDRKKAIDFAFAGALPNVPYLDPALCTRFTANSDCTACSTACPMGEGVIAFDDEEKVFERQVGAIVIATGAALHDSSLFGNLGYGRRADVKTSLEFERMLADSGPTAGKVLLANGTAPRSVSIIHCVGSLDEDHKPYCSGICCQYAFKFNRLLAAALPDITIHHLYRESVFPGTEGYALHMAARKNPKAQFIRYSSIADMKIMDNNGRQIISLAGGEEIEADLVVLCPAVMPGPDADGLSMLLDVPQDRFGFFEALHGRTDSGCSSIRGIYLAGACLAPTDIRGATSQAMAAAGHVLSELVVGRKIELAPLFASVYSDKCSGCKVCANICPYHAIGFDGENGVASVNAVLCQGCGTCVAACPMGAIKANHFTSEMILAEIAGALK